MYSVYRTYFSGDYPARAFIGSGSLLFNARFEMQGIAVKSCMQCFDYELEIGPGVNTL